MARSSRARSLKTGMTIETSGSPLGTGAFYHPARNGRAASVTSVGSSRPRAASLALVAALLALIPALRPAAGASPRCRASRRTPAWAQPRGHATRGSTRSRPAPTTVSSTGGSPSIRSRPATSIRHSTPRRTATATRCSAGSAGCLSAGQAEPRPRRCSAVGARVARARRVRRVAPRRRRSAGRLGRACSSRPTRACSTASVHDLAEPLSAALLLGGLLAYARGRRGLAAAVASGSSSSRRSSSCSCRWRSSRGSSCAAARRLRDAAVFVACLVPAVVLVDLRPDPARRLVHARRDRTRRPVLRAGSGRSSTQASATYSRDGTQNVAAEATLVVLVALLVLSQSRALLCAATSGPTRC